ncbi:DUF3392 domain-containing protein [Vibrio olivae]|uniref:DUF3392 domain-containing protein n=1 Tax=Vibrio olivae TaxID=1243002 RepID=A0ABV5HI70_9VIBR
MLSFFAPAGQLLLPYLSEISMSLIACLLVMGGGEINTLVRRLMRNQMFIVRTIVFVLINAFGYGLIIVKVTPYLTRTLHKLEPGMMFVVVIISFIVIGSWAQRNRHI